MKISELDIKVIHALRKSYLPVARISLFVVFFWFGFLKLLDLSPATALARDLVEKIGGGDYFNELYFALALLECIIGLLFIVPKLVRLVISLLLIHMFIVSMPLFLLPDLTWNSFLVPTLEGQYIIKNLAIIALALVIAAHTVPISKRSKN